MRVIQRNQFSVCMCVCVCERVINASEFWSYWLLHYQNGKTTALVFQKPAKPSRLLTVKDIGRSVRTCDLGMKQMKICLNVPFWAMSTYFISQETSSPSPRDSATRMGQPQIKHVLCFTLRFCWKYQWYCVPKHATELSDSTNYWWGWSSQKCGLPARWYAISLHADVKDVLDPPFPSFSFLIHWTSCRWGFFYLARDSWRIMSVSCRHWLVFKN